MADHEDPRRLRLQRRGDAGAWWRRRMRWACRSKANSAVSVRWRRARRARKTAWAPRASSSRDELLTDPEQAAAFVAGNRRRCAGHRDRHVARRVQVHAASRPATSSRSIASSRFTSAFPTRISSCMARLRCRRNGSRSSANTAARSRRRMACRSRRFDAGIAHGVRKVNIDTDIRLAMTGAIRRALASARSEFDPACAQGGDGGGASVVHGALRGVRLRGTGGAHQADAAGGDGAEVSLRDRGEGSGRTHPFFFVAPGACHAIKSSSTRSTSQPQSSG